MSLLGFFIIFAELITVLDKPYFFEHLYSDSSIDFLTT